MSTIREHAEAAADSLAPEPTTVRIGKKEYELVESRVRRFRADYANRGRIQTHMLFRDNEMVVFRADVFVDDELMATGHAEERRGSSQFTRTSAVEVCETSAVGRALGLFHYGDAGIASADEVQAAQAAQQQPAPQARTNDDLGI